MPLAPPHGESNGEDGMIINNEKWDEIVAATRAGIERWKAAAERDCKDTFSCDVHFAAVMWCL